MDKKNATRAFMERLDAYNKFVEKFYDYLNEEPTDELEEAIGTIAIGLCCEGNELLNEDDIIAKFNRYTKEVAIYKRGLRNEVEHAWPEWMTFTYVNEEEDC